MPRRRNRPRPRPPKPSLQPKPLWAETAADAGEPSRTMKRNRAGRQRVGQPCFYLLTRLSSRAALRVNLSFADRNQVERAALVPGKVRHALSAGGPHHRRHRPLPGLLPAGLSPHQTIVELHLHAAELQPDLLLPAGGAAGGGDGCSPPFSFLTADFFDCSTQLTQLAEGGLAGGLAGWVGGQPPGKIVQLLVPVQ